MIKSDRRLWVFILIAVGFLPVAVPAEKKEKVLARYDILVAPKKAVTKVAAPRKTVLYFQLEKTRLTADHKSRLLQLPVKPGSKVTVSGHADSSGKEAVNVVLSQKRAEVVAKFLSSHNTNCTVVVNYYGSSRPVADNKKTAGRAANRRVQVKFFTLQNSASNR